LYIFNDPSKQSLVLLASLRSAEPSIMTRFFKNRQTFFAFFRFSQPLHWEAAAVRVFCGAFDYDTVFSTSSTSRGLFLSRQSLRSTRNPEAASSPSFSAEPSIMTRFLEPDQDRRAFFVLGDLAIFLL
ncbi:hypothetical protein, partial [Variovorax ginsengisoli]